MTHLIKNSVACERYIERIVIILCALYEMYFKMLPTLHLGRSSTHQSVSFLSSVWARDFMFHTKLWPLTLNGEY